MKATVNGVTAQETTTLVLMNLPKVLQSAERSKKFVSEVTPDHRTRNNDKVCAVTFSVLS